MNSNTVLIVVIVGLGIAALVAWNAYQQAQNSLPNQLEKLAGPLLAGFL